LPLKRRKRGGEKTEGESEEKALTTEKTEKTEKKRRKGKGKKKLCH
jgi:hypothetical protein